MEEVRAIVAGGRDFNNYGWLTSALDALIKEFSVTKIINGGAKGADYLAAKYCVDNNFPIEYYKVSREDWAKYGPAAGPRRNRLMAKNADILLAFWDKKSRGTKNMIEEARKQHLDIQIFYYEISPDK